MAFKSNFMQIIAFLNAYADQGEIKKDSNGSGNRKQRAIVRRPGYGCYWLSKLEGIKEITQDLKLK